MCLKGEKVIISTTIRPELAVDAPKLITAGRSSFEFRCPRSHRRLMVNDDLDMAQVRVLDKVPRCRP